MEKRKSYKEIIASIDHTSFKSLDHLKSGQLKKVDGWKKEEFEHKVLIENLPSDATVMEIGARHAGEVIAATTGAVTRMSTIAVYF